MIPFHRRPRTLLLLVASVTVFAIAATGCYGWWVANAASDPTPTGDAVVVHAGGQRGDRLQQGLELIDQGAARTLVVMLGYRSRRSRSMCGQSEPFEVICPTPDPSNTVGEAEALDRLAEERGWTKVVTVTSDYHLRRASHLDSRCTGVDVARSAAATPRLSRRTKLRNVVKEMVALPVAWVTSC